MYQIYFTESSLNLNGRASQCSHYCIFTIFKFWPSIALHTFQWPHLLRAKHCRIHPRSLLKNAGKEESYSEVQNCIGRALQYISLSILLFTRLCLIMCQWNKTVKALKVQESSKSILQAAAHAQAPKTACKTIIISSKPLKYLQVSNCSHHHFLLARFCWQNSCLSVMYQSGLQNW